MLVIGPRQVLHRGVHGDADAGRTTTVVVMGVSGSGKTTVAQALAQRLGWELAEGDDLHSAADVARMRAGHALDDADRWPWLHRVAEGIGAYEQRGVGAVVTCSALKRSYRDLLRERHPSTWFAHVAADRAVLLDRLVRRSGHYMPASLLDSQLATLEPLGPDEAGVTVAADHPQPAVVEQVLQALRAQHRIGGREAATGPSRPTGRG